jgi:RNA polymerase sigma-70 factor (ECF subfamily)
MATAWNERTLVQMLDLDPRLRGLATRLSHDAHEAEDLVQDAWIAVLTQWPGEPCALEPWAKEVLRNAARKRARRMQPIEWNEAHAEHEPSQNGGVALDELARGERAERLRALIDALPDPYRSTLIQRFYAERSVGEIAAAKGVPRATVSTQLRRALERLRAQLARQRDLLPLVFPWSRAAGRVTTTPVQPWAGLRVAIGAAGLVVVVPFALALSSWRNEDGAASAALEPLALAARAEQTLSEVALADRRAVELSEPADEALLVEARAETGGAPLAGGQLSVWDERGTLRTSELDESGRSRVPGLAGASLLVVEVARFGENTAGFRHFVRPAQGRLEVRVGSGPSLRFTLSGAAGVHPSELRFGLRSSVPGALTSPQLASDLGLRRVNSWRNFRRPSRA